VPRTLLSSHGSASNAAEDRRSHERLVTRRPKSAVTSVQLPAVNATRFDFQDDVESAVAEVPYQAYMALAMANPPMPTPMPIGGRSQSVAVGLTVPFVFKRRSQTGPVGLRTLSGNAVGGVTRREGSNPSRSVFCDVSRHRRFSLEDGLTEFQLPS
jgi:hypothetical protein